MKHLSPLNAFISFFQAVTDFLCLQAALYLGYWFWMKYPWNGNFQYFSEYAQILWILPPIGVIVFRTVGLYKPQEGVIGVEEQSAIFKAIWIIYVIVFAISFFYRGVSFSRLSTFYSVFAAISFISIERFLFRQIIEKLHEKGIGVRRALIYGAGYHGQRLERWIKQSPKLGIVVEGFLDDDYSNLTKRPQESRCLGAIENLDQLVQDRKVSLLFIAHRNLEEPKVLDILNRCRFLNLQCWVIPSVYQFYIERAVLSNIGGIPLIGFKGGPNQSSFYLFLKRVFDVGVSIFLLAVAFPLCFLIALGIKFASSGPFFLNRNGSAKTAKSFRSINLEPCRSATVMGLLRKWIKIKRRRILFCSF